MRILYIITKSNWGGAQVNLYDTASEMIKKGYEVTVALGGNGILSEKLKNTGIRVIEIKNLQRDFGLSKEINSFREIYRIIHDVKPDVLHLHSPKAAGLGTLAGRLLHTPKIIYTVHGWTFNEKRPFYQKTTIAIFSWLTCLFATKIITIARKETEQALMMPIIKKKVIEIPNGVSPKNFLDKAEAKNFLEKHISQSFNENDFLIGCIAELHKNKNLELLIKSFLKLEKTATNIKLIIIGDGEEKENLKKIIFEDKNIFLTGFIKDANQLLRAFDIFVLPSKKEGLPYVLLEAGLAGIPVIATNVGGIGDIIINEKTGLLTPSDNIEKLEENISTSYSHKEIREKYALALGNHIKAKYSLEHMIEKINSLYTH